MQVRENILETIVQNIGIIPILAIQSNMEIDGTLQGGNRGLVPVLNSDLSLPIFFNLAGSGKL